MHAVYFLGRFHVLVLHLPIGILLAVLAVEWAGRRKGYEHLKAAAPFLWGALALTAAVTMVLGYMHFAEGGFTGRSAQAHRLLGTGVALFAILSVALRRRQPDYFARALAVITAFWIVLISLTGHYGGNLTHGSDFLIQYAPGPLRALAGHEAKRPPITSVADADPFLDVISPMLAKRCANCHNDDKQSGKFSVATLASILKGGENGPVIVKGRSADSDLYRRITLPESHKEHMPAEGKTPLTVDQIEIVRWWIDAGTPTAVSLGSLKPDPKLAALISGELSLVTNDAGVAASAEPLPQNPLDQESVAKLRDAGFVVRHVSLADPALQLSLASPGKRLSDAQRIALVAAGQSVVGLDLSNAQLVDADMDGFGILKELQYLQLANNQLSTRGLAFLGDLDKLERLNLYGNRGIDDGAVDTLSRLPHLTRLFLWNTGVTARGIERLRVARPQLIVDSGDTEKVSSAPPAQKSKP